MTRARTGSASGFLVAALVTVIFFGMPAAAQTGESPGVAVSKNQVAPGETIILTIGFFEGTSVTISLCGNGALRGSSDCNMPASQGVALRLDGVSTLAEFPVVAPPVACPCVIRVSSPNNEQVAFAPIDLIGHPVSPLTDSADLTDALAVTIVVKNSTSGVSDRLRSSAGGPTMYSVDVTVKNRTSADFSNVRLAASAGRNREEERVVVPLDDPGKIEGGGTWRTSIDVEMPSVTFGEIEWRATASGAGAPTDATDTTQNTPMLMWVLGVVLLIDIVLLLARFVLRRLRPEPDSPEEGITDDLDGDEPHREVAAIAPDKGWRVPEPVG